MLLYMALCWVRRVPIEMPCLDTIAKYLFFAFVIEFSLEQLDLIHRIYEAGDSFGALDFMFKTRLFVSHIVIQILLGTLLPILLLAVTQVIRLSDVTRRRIYGVAGVLTLVGIFAMRWNVVIGGQLFSKSLLGYTTYKMGFATREGLLPALLIMVLPFVILAVLLRVLPPWGEEGNWRRTRRLRWVALWIAAIELLMLGVESAGRLRQRSQNLRTRHVVECCRSCAPTQLDEVLRRLDELRRTASRQVWAGSTCWPCASCCRGRGLARSTAQSPVCS